MRCKYVRRLESGAAGQRRSGSMTEWSLVRSAALYAAACKGVAGAVTSAVWVGQLARLYPVRRYRPRSCLWIDDHRTPVGRCALRAADLGRGDDPGAILDRTGAQQHLPVVAADPIGEVGRHREDIRPGEN